MKVQSTLRRRAPPPVGTFVVLDLALVAFAVFLAVWLRGHPTMEPFWTAIGLSPMPGLEAWDARHSGLLLLQAAAAPPALWLLGQYRVFQEPGATWRSMRIFAASALATGFSIPALVLLELAFLPRTVYLLTGALTFLFLAAFRALWQTRQQRRHRSGHDLENVLVVGSGPEVDAIMAEFRDHVATGRRVIGRFAFGTEATDVETLVRHHTDRPSIHVDGRFQGDGSTLDQVLLGFMVDEVFIEPGASEQDIHRILAACHPRGIDIHLLAPRIKGVRPTPHIVGDNVALNLHRTPMSRPKFALKRTLDVVGAIVGLMLFFPVLLIAAVAIKLEDPRLPIIYKGRRCGRNGHPFTMYKLNTMRMDAQRLESGLQEKNERHGPWFKLDADEDPRLTKVGRFLRKYSLNEIPQFWNVLRGDMSLVGPRPPTPAEVATYVDHDFRYFRCLDATPGITGLWQTTCKNDPSFDKRLALDIEYAEKWSIWLDLRILFKTLWVVVRQPE